MCIESASGLDPRLDLNQDSTSMSAFVNVDMSWPKLAEEMVQLAR